MKFKYYSKEIKNIERLDPNLENGCDKIYEIELNVEIKLFDENYISNEKINFIIYFNSSSKLYTFQLLSNTDLFFDYKINVDKMKFKKLNLNIEFNEFHENLINLLNNNLNKNKFQMIIKKNGSSKFVILNNLKFKTIELLSWEFEINNEEDIKKFISFKFSILKKKYSYLNDKLEVIYDLIKLKNPNLLIQFTNYYNKNVK